MGGSHQVAGVDERGATHIHVLAPVAPQDSAVPRVLSKVRVSLLEAGGLHAAQIAHRVTFSAAGADGALPTEYGAAAAHTTEATRPRQCPKLQR